MGSYSASGVWRPLGGLWALVLVVYGRILGHPFVRWDDAQFILDNPLIRAAGEQSWLDHLLTPGLGYVVPVTISSQAVLWAIGGGEAWPFHLFSLLVHGAGVSLLFALCRQLGAATGAAFVAAALFAIHPICVEPVAWATGQKDLLATALALGATWAFVASRHGWAVALLSLSVLAKPSTGVVPGAWALWLLSQHGRRAFRHDGARAIFLSIVAAAVVTGLSAIAHKTLIPDQGGSLSRGSFHPLLSLGHTLAHLLWPAQLHPLYVIDRGAGFGDPLTTLGLLGLLAAVAGLWLARRAGPALMGLAFAGCAWIPVSNLKPLTRFVADSYAYLMLAGFCVALAALLSRRERVWLALLPLLVVLGIRSFVQVPRWSSDEALWRPVAEGWPEQAEPWVQLGEGLMLAGQPAEAAKAYQASFAAEYRPDMLGNLGAALLTAGQLAEAECVFAEAQHHGANADEARNNLAVLLSRHPKHPIAHAAEADAAIRWAAERARRQELPWSRETLLGLQARAAALPGAPVPTTAWPKAHCAALR